MTYIPPELFPLIAACIPLRSANQTLLSLAMGNHYLYDVVRPLLYSRLVLENEAIAISVMKRILEEPQLGMAVAELYIMADLSIETREGKNPFDVLEGLQKLVDNKLIPRLISLGIYLTGGWVYDEYWNEVLGHGRLPAHFWKNLRTVCPRLRSLSLRNIGNDVYDPWLSESAIEEINRCKGLSIFRLENISWGRPRVDDLMILENLPRHAATLQTLSLKTDFQSIEYILPIDFPNLKWLLLELFTSNRNHVPGIMAFFWRHPQLESISIINCTSTCDWFSDDIKDGFLPNLRHLKATFDDIRHWIPILPQLTSLGFTKSYSCQVPYLLRAVIPNGLPNLKSLEIKQSSTSFENRKLEGIPWYETADGQFITQKKHIKSSRTFLDDYMYSIVRGAPNLEELGLHGMTLQSDALEVLAPILAQLKHMQRFYYRGFSINPKYGNAPKKEEHEELLRDFLSSARMLGHHCLQLEKVTSISGRYLPYISGIIERDSNGEVTEVRKRDSIGMEIPAEDDDPFPWNED